MTDEQLEDYISWMRDGLKYPDGLTEKQKDIYCKGFWEGYNHERCNRIENDFSEADFAVRDGKTIVFHNGKWIEASDD